MATTESELYIKDVPEQAESSSEDDNYECENDSNKDDDSSSSDEQKDDVASADDEIFMNLEPEVELTCLEDDKIIFQPVTVLDKKSAESDESSDEKDCDKKSGKLTVLKCLNCNERFKNEQELNKHVAKSCKKIFKCLVCNKSFGTNTLVRRHMSVHSGTKDHECPVCNKQFTQKYYLKIHMLIHEGVKPHKCEICHKSFTQRGTLKAHMLIHTQKVDDSLLVPTDVDTCQESYDARAEKDNDDSAHAYNEVFVKMESEDFDLLNESQEKSKRTYTCAVCEKNFNCKSNLTKHMVTHTGTKEFECSICNKFFSLKSSLKKHELIHKGIKPHKCCVCDKTFTHNGSLHNHMLSHNDTKKFACPICGKKFSRKSNLKIHLSNHDLGNHLYEPSNTD